MLDVAPTELLLIAIVALLVIGPKDLPKAMRFVGQWVAKAKRTAAHFRSGIDTMMREAELEEMEKKWKAENERIMRDHPPAADYPDPPAIQALPRPDISAEDAEPQQVAQPVIRDDAAEIPLTASTSASPSTPSRRDEPELPLGSPEPLPRADRLP